MALNNQNLRALAAGDEVKDYKHAARIFVDSNFRLAPKNAFLFHVAFDVDVTLTEQKQDRILEAGLMVKQSGLPRFKIDSKTYNAYNRPNIVQTKVKYEELEIVFHDDNADVVRDFWFNYYNYYYRDADTGLASQNAPHKYQQRLTDKWGYTLRRESEVPKMLRSIRIYVLHQKRFTEYLLVNPLITGWGGSTLDVSQGNGTVESKMTVAYEAVIFSSGNLVADDIPSFFKLRYDNTPSDITTPAAKAAGQTATQQLSLLEELKSGYNKVSSTAGQLAGIARDTRGLIQQGTQFKNDVKAFKTGIQDFKNFGKYILQGSNPFSQIRVPDMSNLVRGYAQVEGQVGKMASAFNVGQSLTAATSDKKGGSMSSNQQPVSVGSIEPAYWTSTADGAKPPLPLSSTTRVPAATEQLTASKKASASSLESSAINSGYVKDNQLKLTKSLFTNSKNVKNDQEVEALKDRLDAAEQEAQQQQNYVDQYLNTPTRDTGPDAGNGSEWGRGS